MAEAVVGVLIGKLGAALAKEAASYGASLLCKEASALKGLFGEIRKAEAELESMNAYLRDSEKFKDTDETIGIFINKIRQLSFRAEDVVDEFMYKLEDSKHGGFVAKMKKRIKHVKVWHRLAFQLREINTELEDTIKRRDRYAIPGMQGHSKSNGDHHATSTNKSLCSAREEDLVGIEENAEKLKGWLVNDLEERNTKITTVWGMGGVGKTTLVDHVFKIVKVHFDAVAWVTVSKSYQNEDLVKKIAIEFGTSISSSNMDMRRVVDVIRNHLHGKRVLLVLDDIWDQGLWINNIMPIFPTNCTSRFVLTSRLFEIASLATSNCAINLEPLQEYHSYMLFCKLAFQNNDAKWCPSELRELAEKFLQKCEGLPIAIACIGRLLSCKPPTYSEWENVYEKLELQSTKNVIPGVDTILKISLEDLPYELINCFLHCAIFPEDYILKRRRLIRHWITAGFIKEKANKTLEEVAENFLNELVNRSLLQVTATNEIGRVKCYQMHDFIRHIAVDKAAKECFGKVYDGHRSIMLPVARRLSIQSTNVAPLNQSGGPHLRAIHAFTGFVDIDLLRPILASSLLLSILDLQGTQVMMLPSEIFCLFNLRFLGLRYTRIEILPEAIGKLQNLEVLDAAATALVSLPKNVEKLRKLRYLYAFTLREGSNHRHFCGVMVPRGIRHLTGLHALQRVTASLETLREVAALTELRTFAVTDVTSQHSLNLCHAIMNMNHLAHLSVDALDNNEVLPIEALNLPESLNKLELTGQLEKTQMPQTFSSWSHLKNLNILTLWSSKLNEDAFSSLVMLPSLCFLGLYNEAYNGKIMCFSGQSFPRLRRLEILGASQLNQVKIEKGALESLAVLVFSRCRELKHLPHGIEYITNLEELYMTDTAEELIEKLTQGAKSYKCNEEYIKIRHIRKVVVRLTEKNKWKRIR
ncbi:unnamed protein product [Urochloa humidicola]